MLRNELILALSMSLMVASCSKTEFSRGTPKVLPAKSGDQIKTKLEGKGGNALNIEVTPATASIFVGASVVYKAVAVFDDGTRQELDPTTVTWSISDDSIGGMTANDGKAVGLKAGDATVKAIYLDKSATAGLNVTVDGPSPTPTPVATVTPTPIPTPNTTDKVNISTDKGQEQIGRCSADTWVSSHANIWFAQSTSFQSLWYNSYCPTSTAKIGRPDYAWYEAPAKMALIDQACLTPGTKLYFDVNGAMSHGNSPSSGADGTSLASHVLGPIDGKSNITAPYNAVIGVFLADTLGVVPVAPDFSTVAARDYTVFKPQIGQVFFIGDGFTSGGKGQAIEVPVGAKNLWLGVMDSCVWADNGGGYTVSTFWSP